MDVLDESSNDRSGAVPESRKRKAEEIMDGGEEEATTTKRPALDEGDGAAATTTGVPSSSSALEEAPAAADTKAAASAAPPIEATPSLPSQPQQEKASNNPKDEPPQNDDPTTTAAPTLSAKVDVEEKKQEPPVDESKLDKKQEEEQDSTAAMPPPSTSEAILADATAASSAPAPTDKDPTTTTSPQNIKENGAKEASETTNKDTAAVDTETPSAAKDSTAANNSTDATASTNDKADNSSVNEPNKSSDNPYDNMRWITVRNDGRPESMIKLIGLKSLFAKQLPKMPRAYIARLVLDRRHTSLAILSDNPALKDSDEEIIGGICYRAFPEQRFAEIAFCAVNASHQVKGYGTKLMNLLKQTGARTGLEYYITYADNYAIGYFKKQGFTKSITMPKGRYQGLIKDYDGGTPMECYVHPSIDFFRVPAMIQAQRAFLLHRIRQTAQSATTVYPPPLVNNSNNSNGGGSTSRMAALASSRRTAAQKILAVPGVAQAGWTLQDLVQTDGGNASQLSLQKQQSSLKQELLSLLRKIEEQQYAWPFREPVDTTEVPDYLDVITDPIDLKTMEKRIQQNYYKSKHMLAADLQLMVDNCKTYNEDGSTYTQCAVSLEKFCHQLLGPPPPPAKASTTSTSTTANESSSHTATAVATTTTSANNSSGGGTTGTANV